MRKSKPEFDIEYYTNSRNLLPASPFAGKPVNKAPSETGVDKNENDGHRHSLLQTNLMPSKKRFSTAVNNDDLQSIKSSQISIKNSRHK